MTREEAIKKLMFERDNIDTEGYCGTKENYAKINAYNMAIEALQEVQKHEKTFEWCHDCKEYDTDNHCCHRWSKVIRNTVEELKTDRPQAEAEPTVIRSKTLLPTKDFKEWAKRVRETNPNVIVIPCDAEVVSAEAEEAVLNKMLEEEMIVLPQDYVKVVRCKDCEYKRLYDEGDTKYYYCALEDRPNRNWSVDDTDYCSWGEESEAEA